MTAHVLLVEDDLSLSGALSSVLQREGYEVTMVTSAEAALEAATDDFFDLLILDVMLPGMSGIALLETIRRSSDVPVLVVSGRSHAADAVLGLESGADDYLRKPFEMAELKARARALLRRRSSFEETSEVIRVVDLEIDMAALKVFKAGKEIALSRTEFSLLAEFIRNPGRVLSRAVLLDRIWGYDYLGDSRSVDMAVTRLRAKIEDDPSAPKLITTVRGVGYRLDAA